MYQYSPEQVPLAFTVDGAWMSVGAHVTKLDSSLEPEQQDAPHGTAQGWLQVAALMLQAFRLLLPQRVSMCEPLRSVVTRFHGPVLLRALHKAFL